MAKVEQLAARVTVEDNASKQFEKMVKSVQKTNNELLRLKAGMDRLKRSTAKRNEVKVDTRQAQNNVGRLERAFRGLHRVIGDTGRVMKGIGGFASRLTPSSLTGALGVVGGGYLGKQAFDSTFLNAANFEMSGKTIEAMMNNKKKSDLYMREMEKMAIGSPLLNSQDIFGNSKSFIALTKEQKQLNQMWDLSERLLAVDPKQGVEGAVFALRELFSGDAQSMAERFEMPKKVLNEIKKLPLDQQLRKLDKLFNSMGMTKKLVNEMGDTTLGVWNQIKETTDVALRNVGEPAVKIVKPFLDEVNKAFQGDKKNKYIQFGQDMASGIAEGFVSMAGKTGKWIDGIVSNPEFKDLKLYAKVNYVFEDIQKRFSDWLSTGGQDKINSATKTLLEVMSVAVVNSSDIIIQTFGVIGKAAGSAFIASASEGIMQWQKDKLESSKLFNLPITKPIKWAGQAGIAISEFFTKAPEYKSSYKPKTPYERGMERAQPYAFGIQSVPRNNFPALLHEGERVLTKQENSQMKNGGGVTINIAKLADRIDTREEADIDKIINKLVKAVEKERVSFGGAY